MLCTISIQLNNHLQQQIMTQTLAAWGQNKCSFPHQNQRKWKLPYL